MLPYTAFALTHTTLNGGIFRDTSRTPEAYPFRR
jgi:hypothetical protein